MMNQFFRKIKGHESAQCKVRITEDESGTRRAIELISYNTNVCGIYFNEDGDYLECSGTYSQTTRKHIGWFAKEYCPARFSYFTFKNIVDKGLVPVSEA